MYKTNLRHSFYIVLFWLFFCCVADASVNFSESMLGKSREGEQYVGVITPLGLNSIAIHNTENKVGVRVNNMPEVYYTRILFDTIEFNNDGSGLTFAASDSQGWYVNSYRFDHGKIIEPTVFGPYAKIAKPSTSPVTGDACFPVKTSQGWGLIFNGKALAAYDGIVDKSIAYSNTDADRIVFASGGGKGLFIVDGSMKSETFEYLGNSEAVSISPCGEVGYIFSVDHKWYFSLGGVKYGPYEGFYSERVQYGLGKGQFAILAKVDGYVCAIIDGKEVGKYDYIIENSIKYTNSHYGVVFHGVRKGESIFYSSKLGERAFQSLGPIAYIKTTISEHLGFVWSDGKRWHCELDGKEVCSYDKIANPGLILSAVDDQYGLFGLDSEGWHAFVNGKQVDPKLTGFLAGSVAFAGDGSRYALAISSDGKNYVIDDKGAAQIFDALAFELFRFIGNDRILSYVGRRANECYYVIGSKFEGPYNTIQSSGIEVAPDGKSYFYIVNFNSKEGTQVAFNGVLSKKYEKLLVYPGFLKTGELCFVAKSEDNIFKVTCGAKPKGANP